MRLGKELSDLQRLANKSIIINIEKLNIILTSICESRLEPRDCPLGYYSTVSKGYCVKKMEKVQLGKVLSYE
jgi:hypothetical protein